MAVKRSPGSFCSLVATNPTGTTDSIAAINVGFVGNGAEAYCTSVPGVYRYDASSSATAAAPLVVAPNSGAGRWTLQNPALLLAAEFTAGAPLAGTAGAGTGLTWTPPPAGTNFYAPGPTTSAFWTIDTTLGTVTYAGIAGRKFLVLTSLSINSGAARVMEIDLSINNSLQGLQTGTLTSQQTTVPANGNITLQHQILITVMAAGVSIVPVYRMLAGSGPIIFDAYQITVTPVG